MESGPSLGLQPGQAEMLLASPPVALALDLGGRTPSGFSAVTFPRQDPPPAQEGAAHTGPEGSDAKEEEAAMGTYISDSTTVTSADEEKLLLLNRNTELRRINKELTRLNLEWEGVYHSATRGLQQQLGALQEEAGALRMQAQRLSLKLEHEQGTREYYQQALFQELKRSQAVQDYVRQLEGQRPPGQEVQESRALLPLPWEKFLEPGRSRKGDALKQPKDVLPAKACSSRDSGAQELHCCAAQQSPADPQEEISNLQLQLEALRCQTEVYEADYKLEHKERQRIKAENAKLRRKEVVARQQVALLEEQLKVFEDDFWRERSDKQVLQRLLKARPPWAKEPPPTHRCSSPEKAPAPSPGLCPCSCHGKEYSPCRGKRN